MCQIVKSVPLRHQESWMDASCNLWASLLLERVLDTFLIRFPRLNLLHAESRAIARYISEKFENQGTPLFGETPKDRALVNQWFEVESQNYNPAVSSIVAQVLFNKFKGLTTDEKVVEEQLAKLEKVLDVYEEHLSKNKYLAGNFFSIADLSHLPYTHYLVNVAKKGEGLISRKHVNAWWEDISSRPAWKKVLELQAKKWFGALLTMYRVAHAPQPESCAKVYVNT